MDIKNLLISLLLSTFKRNQNDKLDSYLIPFSSSRSAVRRMPLTSELNVVIDGVLLSVSEVLSGQQCNFTLDSFYRPFAHLLNGDSISGTFKTSNGRTGNLTSLRRKGNSYIYINTEESVQIVATMTTSPLCFTFEQYHLILGKLYECGSIDAVVDTVFVDVKVTVDIKQNVSLPSVIVCKTEIDEVSLNMGQFHLSMSGLKGNEALYVTLFRWLATHFTSSIYSQLQALLFTSLQDAFSSDLSLCSSLVLCNNCSV